MKLVIVDYKVGNLGSIYNILKRIGIDSIISSDPEVITKADKLILGGVGTFDKGMENLEQLNLIPVLYKKVVEEKAPLLGICLGMQLLTKESEEGTKPGLGWIKGTTKKIPSIYNDTKIKVPHIGWNDVHPKTNSKLFSSLKDPRFYFVHSYNVILEDTFLETSTSTYNGLSITSSIEKDNILGVQFHPEKSHRFGRALMENFVHLY